MLELVRTTERVAPANKTSTYLATVRVHNGEWKGSGVIVAHDGTRAAVMTAFHVLRDGAGRPEAELADGRRLPAVKGPDGNAAYHDRDQHDLACFFVETASVPGVAPIASSDPKPGDSISFAGWGSGRWANPSGRVVKLTTDARTREKYLEFVPGPISGDSGGPVFNARNETCGILWGSSNPSGNRTTGEGNGTPAPVLREFFGRVTKKTGWLLGPNINITNPAPAAPIQAGPDPFAASQIAGLQGKVDALSSDVESLKLGVNTFESRVQRLEFNDRENEDIKQWVRDHRDELHDFAAKVDKVAADKALAALNDYEAKQLVARQKHEAELALLMENQRAEKGAIDKLADRTGNAEGAALRAENAVATVESKVETRLQQLYTIVPDSVKTHVAERIHEKLDKVATPELVSSGLSALDARLRGDTEAAKAKAEEAIGAATGVQNKDLASYGIFGVVALVLGGIGLKALKAKNPALGAVVERVGVPAARALIRRIKRKRADGTEEEETIEEQPAA